MSEAAEPESAVADDIESSFDRRAHIIKLHCKHLAEDTITDDFNVDGEEVKLQAT